MNKDIKELIETYLNENTTDGDLIKSYFKECNFNYKIPTHLIQVNETTIENCAPFIIENNIYNFFVEHVCKKYNEYKISPLLNSKSSSTNKNRLNEWINRENISIVINKNNISYDFIIIINNIPYYIEIKSYLDTQNINISPKQHKNAYNYIFVTIKYSIDNNIIIINSISSIGGSNIMRINKNNNKTKYKIQYDIQKKSKK